MYIIRGFFLILLIVGIIMLVIYFLSLNYISKSDNKIIYKYIPRSLEEEMESPVYVSDIFKTMFSQPSTWIDSFDADAERRKENINTFFISQM
jgi:hypothetical protein